MAHTIERIALPSPSPGTDRHLLVHRFGRKDARPRVWLQAALHADELPGPLVLHHLMPKPRGGRSRRPDPRRDHGRAPGQSGGSDARSWAACCRAVTPSTARETSTVASSIYARISLEEAVVGQARRRRGRQRRRRSARRSRRCWPSTRPTTRAPILKLTLHRLAATARTSRSTCIATTRPRCTSTVARAKLDAFTDLAARLGAAALLTAEDSGDTPFDEALTRPWWRLIERNPDKPIPERCDAVLHRWSCAATPTSTTAMAQTRRRRHLRLAPGAAARSPARRHQHPPSTVPGNAARRCRPRAHAACRAVGALRRAGQRPSPPARSSAISIDPMLPADMPVGWL